MPKTLKDSWISFRLFKSSFLYSVILVLSGIVAGYIYANLRYEHQAHGVDGNYAYEYLSEQGVSTILLDATASLFTVETGMADAMLLVQKGTVLLSRIYEYEFDPACAVTKLQLLEAINSAKIGGLGAMVLWSFDGTKAVVQVSYQTLLSNLTFQQNWRGLLKRLDLNDRILDMKLEAFVGEENVRRNLIEVSDYGRIFNSVHDARNYAPSAIQGMIDLMQQ